jgi:hypothetical protein
MDDLAAVGERELARHCQPQFVWDAEVRRWPHDILAGLIGREGKVVLEPERCREFCGRLERLIRAYHDRKGMAYDRMRGGDGRKRTTTMQAEIGIFAAKVREVAAAPEGSDLQFIGIGTYIHELEDDTNDYLDDHLMTYSYRRCPDAMPSSISKLGLPELIVFLEDAGAQISKRRGRAGCPIEYALVDKLCDLWLEATGELPRRINLPRNRGKDGSKGVESGRFLAFCRAVVAAVENGHPYVGGEIEKRLSHIVRRVMDEKKPGDAAASNLGAAYRL